MIKPGSRDIKVSMLISGDQLLELKRFTYAMCEAYGLDRKIENYQGKRPIGLYRWDFDCLMSVLEYVMSDDKEYPNKNSPQWESITQLYERFSAEYQKAFRT